MRPEPSGAGAVGVVDAHHNRRIDWLRYRRRPSGFAYVGCGSVSVWHVARTTDADTWTLEEMPNHHPGCWFVAGTYPTAAAARSNAEGADGRRVGPRMPCGQQLWATSSPSMEQPSSRAPSPLQGA